MRTIFALFLVNTCHTSDLRNPVDSIDMVATGKESMAPLTNKRWMPVIALDTHRDWVDDIPLQALYECKGVQFGLIITYLTTDITETQAPGMTCDRIGYVPTQRQ